MINSYGLVILMALIIFVTGLFGSHFGYSVNGELVQGAGWEDFMGALVTFQIDGMPAFMSIIFILMPVFAGWILYRQLRGQD